MPATDDYLRSPKLMHRVFCASALLLLFTTVWMMYADNNDEWRTYQRQAFKYQGDRIRSREAAEKAAPEHKQNVAELEARIKKAEAELAKRGDEAKTLTLAAKAASDKSANHLRDLKVLRAKRDVARANYNLAIRDNLHGDDLKQVIQEYEDIEADVSKMESDNAENKLKLDVAKASLSAVTGERDKAQKELKGEQTKIVLLHAALNKIDPDTWLSKTKRNLMLLPIIDGFNSPERITQDWLPRLEFPLGGMGVVSRFDRCRTCHAMIDSVDDTIKTSVTGAFPHGLSKDGKQTADGKFPHPFASHPRLDVYLGATSPHPLPKFGCTVCHEGQGSGTSFQNASHTPNDPAQMHEWADEHKWFDNHFWERPMNPKRFEESSCIKCHVNVTELAVNPKFGPTAPKVARGHRLVETYGCFGCHEIQGFEGTKIIGPDLRLEPSTPEEAVAIAADPNQVAGKMRKVGPSLRHLALKVDAGFVASWTEEPKRFRPTTRMPQFFKLDNQSDAHGQKFNPVEIAAITHYLLAKSTEFQELAAKDDQLAYKPLARLLPDAIPSAERGKEFFATKGCINCHTHDAVKGLDMTFGPELSNVHEKLKAGNFGFDWLYTWVREPSRYHPRTRMPAQPLEVEKVDGVDTDPAADIAAFLLKLKPEEKPADYKPTPATPFEVPSVDDAVLDELVSHFLGKVLTKSQIEGFIKGSDDKNKGEYPVLADRIKGDEIELLAKGQAELDDTEWKNRKLTYLGRKTITRYGCYGCHDIPNFEQARPIGTALQDWGKKDRSRLAFEHIHEYLHHHGEPDFGVKVESVTANAASGTSVRVTKGGDANKGGLKTGDIIVSLDKTPVLDAEQYEAVLGRTVVGSHVAVGVIRDGHEQTLTLAADASLLDRVEAGIGRAKRDEFKTEASRDRETSAAFYVESLLHHGRPGFLWQKLRQPRSYDHKMIETKPYDDRLRMPKFPFSEEDIDAIATFVLGLVAEPPAAEYLYNPSGPAGARIRGEKLIEQFNCSGCHMLELPKIRYAADVDGITASDTSIEYPEAIALLKKLRPMRDGTTGEMKSVKVGDAMKSLPIIQFHGMVAGEPEVDLPLDEQEYVVELWETLRVAGKELFPTYKFIFPATNLDKIEAARGGKYAEWLVERLVNNKKAKEKSLAWQMSPPPLYKEGTKVQTPWLFNFLKNPGKLRHTTVLRMPRFNLSDEEAQALANYFAAVDGTPFPYQLIEEREPAYLSQVGDDFDKAFPDKKGQYLHDSWQMLNGDLCIKCHSVGGRQVVISDPAKDIRGPDLDLAAERLKPDWLQLWLFNPKWVTPYTSMPSPLPPQQANAKPRYPELFGADGLKQTISLRDALVNYHRQLEREGKTAEAPKPAAATAGGGQ